MLHLALSLDTFPSSQLELDETLNSETQNSDSSNIWNFKCEQKESHSPRVETASCNPKIGSTFLPSTSKAMQNKVSESETRKQEKHETSVSSEDEFLGKHFELLNVVTYEFMYIKSLCKD